MRLSAAAHGGGDEACLGQGRDTGRDNTWGTSAAHQERSCSPHVARGTSSGSSSCDAGAACRNPVVHPRKQPGYAGQPATVGSARGSKPASGTMVANRSAAVAAAACRRMLRRTNMQCARRRRHAGGEDSAHGRGVLVHAQLSRHVALSCTITTALARAARAGPLHGSAHLATQAEPVASRGSARPPRRRSWRAAASTPTRMPRTPPTPTRLTVGTLTSIASLTLHLDLISKNR